MGDYADMALDETLDEEDARLAYHLGQIDDFEAYDRGIIDERGYEYYGGRTWAQPWASRLKTCKWCGAEKLHWKETPHGWRLVDHNDLIHTCKQYQRPINSTTLPPVDSGAEPSKLSLVGSIPTGSANEKVGADDRTEK